MDTDIPTSFGATSAYHDAPDPHTPLFIEAHQPEPALFTPGIANHTL
jgi:hypothetical protein